MKQVVTFLQIALLYFGVASASIVFIRLIISVYDEYFMSEMELEFQVKYARPTSL